MATTASPTMNDTEKQAFVSRVVNIPIINEGLTNAQSVIQSNSYSAAAYDKASVAAVNLYKATEPFQTRLQPQLEAVDKFANKSLDYVQDKFPYAFAASSGDMMSRARKPADDAAAAAKARLLPIAEQFQVQLQAASTSLHSVQERLAHAVASLPRSPQDASAAAKEAASSLLTEIERIRDTVAAQAKELPSQLQASYTNLSEHLSKGATDIRAELARSDVSLSVKTSKILSISRDHGEEVLKDTLAAVKGVISKRADETEGFIDDSTPNGH